MAVNIDNDRINRIRETASGGSRTAPVSTPSVGVKNTPSVNNQPQTFKSRFSNISDDDWDLIFKDNENFKTQFFNIMDGVNNDAVIAMKKDPKQALALNYWKKTYKEGLEAVQLLNDNRNALTDEQQAEFFKKLNRFQGYHKLAERAAIETLGGNFNIDPTKAWDKQKDTKYRTDEYADRYIYDPSQMKLVKYLDFQQRNQDIQRGTDFYSNIKLEDKPWINPRVAGAAGGGATALGLFMAGAAATSWTGPGMIVGGLVSLAGGLIYGALTTPDDVDTRAVKEHYGYSHYMKEVGKRPPELKARLNLLLGDWASESLKLNAPNQKSKFESASAYNQNILNSYSYVQDIIKEGFKSKNKEIRDQTKVIFDQLAKYKGDWKGKVKLLQNADFRHDVTNLLQNNAFSYYSKVNLYYKHKKNFSEAKYIDGSKLEAFAKSKNVDVETAKGWRAARLEKEIGQFLDLQQSRNKKDLDLKTKYRSELSDSDMGKVSQWFNPNGLSNVFNKGMFDKGGNPISFEKWFSSLPEDGAKSSLYTNNVKLFEKTMADVKRMAKPGSISSNDVELRNNLIAKMKDKNAAAEVNAFYSIYGVNYRKPKDAGFIYKQERIPGLSKTKQGESYNNLKEAYNNYKNAYKSKWDAYESTQNYANSSMIAGLGANGAYELKDHHINLNLDVPKSQNSNNFINYITKAVSSPGSNIYIKNGKWKFDETVKDLEGEESVKNATVENFFKDKKADYDLTYVNYLRDEGYALYMYKNNKTNKTLSIVIPKSLAKQSGEQFASHEYNDNDDFWFDNTGEQELKYYGSNSFSKDAKIYTDGANNKVLYARVKDPENPSEYIEKDIILGPSHYMTIDQAVANSLQFLKKYNDQFTQKSINF